MDNPTPEQPAQPNDGDISKQTLVVLVILSCVISLVGVVAMVYQFSNARAATHIIENGGTSTAQVGLSIQGPPAPAPAREPVKSTGFASFEIQKQR